jgi:hypothetical protein
MRTRSPFIAARRARPKAGGTSHANRRRFTGVESSVLEEPSRTPLKENPMQPNRTKLSKIQVLISVLSIVLTLVAGLFVAGIIFGILWHALKVVWSS